MSEKRKESKIMSMLERKGFVQKIDDVSNSDAGTPLNGNESDIKPLFNVPDNAINITPAPRQPVPGMPSPIFPSEKPAVYEDTFPVEPPVSNEAPPAANPIAEFLAESVASAPQIQPTQVQPQKPASAFSSLNIFRNGNAPEEAPAVLVAAPAEHEQQPENYTDRYLNITELYDALALRSKKTDTIYLIEDYLKTLPDSLPDSSRRDIVYKLISASGFDYDLLMGDGVLRVKMLKEYAERFARHTDDYIAARQAELDELEQRIIRTQKLIESRKELHKKQFFTIEAEAQRLKEILTFISG